MNIFPEDSDHESEEYLYGDGYSRDCESNTSGRSLEDDELDGPLVPWHNPQSTEVRLEVRQVSPLQLLALQTSNIFQEYDGTWCNGRRLCS
jgi:hypothetical protein